MYEIWHDNDFDLAHWFYLNSDLRSQEVVLRQIPKTNGPTDLLNYLKTNSDLGLLPAIKYETPDIILIKNDGINEPKIELVVEFMTHTPQHDHPLQRFTRIYGSAWLGIPSILIIPENKEKLEKGKRDSYRPMQYSANPLIYHLFIKTCEITKTPTLLMMWPEVNGYLKYDKQHPTAPRIEQDISLLFSIVNRIVNSKDINDLSEIHKKKQIETSGYKPAGNEYKLKTGEVISTSVLIENLGSGMSDDKTSFLKDKNETFLYSPNGLKSQGSAFRTDPYAGKLCAFDILFCRDADGVRIRNLVLRANGISSKTKSNSTLIDMLHTKSECPFLIQTDLVNAKKHFKSWCPYTERKQQRIYGEVPDLVIYDNEEVYVPRR